MPIDFRTGNQSAFSAQNWAGLKTERLINAVQRYPILRVYDLTLDNIGLKKAVAQANGKAVISQDCTK